jgi:hypothetical protein
MIIADDPFPQNGRLATGDKYPEMLHLKVNMVMWPAFCKLEIN